MRITYYLFFLSILASAAFAVDCAVSGNTQCCVMQNASTQFTVGSSFTNATAGCCFLFNSTNQQLVFKVGVVVTGGAAGSQGICTAQGIAASSTVSSPNVDIRNFTTAAYSNKTVLWITRKNYACLTGSGSCVQFDGATGSGINDSIITANGTGLYFNAMSSGGYATNMTITSNTTCIHTGSSTGLTISNVACTNGGNAAGGMLFLSTSSSGRFTNVNVTTSGTTGACAVSGSANTTMTNVRCTQTGSAYAIQLVSTGTSATINGGVFNNTGTGIACEMRTANTGTWNGTTCAANASAGWGTLLTGFTNATFANGTITGGSATVGAVQMRLITQNNSVYGNQICQNAGTNAVQLLAGNVLWNTFYNNTFCNVSGATVNYTAGVINYFNGTVNGSCKGNWYNWMNESVDAFDTDGDSQADTGTQYIFNSTSVPDRFVGANVSDNCPSPGRHYAPQNLTFTNPSSNNQNITAFQPYLLNWTFNLWGATTFAGCNLTLDGTNYTGTNISATQCQYSLSSYGNHTIQGWVSASDWFGTKSNSTAVWNFTLTQPPLVQNCSWIQPSANGSSTTACNYDFQWSCQGENITACWLNASNTVVNGTYHAQGILTGACTNNEECYSGSCVYGFCSRGEEQAEYCNVRCRADNPRIVCMETFDGCAFGTCLDFQDCGGGPYGYCDDNTSNPSGWCVCLGNSGGSSVCSYDAECCSGTCNETGHYCIGFGGSNPATPPPNWNLSWCNATYTPATRPATVSITGYMQNNYTATNSTPTWAIYFGSWYHANSNGLIPPPVVGLISNVSCALETADVCLGNVPVNATILYINGTQISINNSSIPANQNYTIFSYNFTNTTAGDRVVILCNFTQQGVWAYSQPQTIRPARFPVPETNEAILAVFFLFTGMGIIFAYLHVTAQNPIWKGLWQGALLLTGVFDFGTLMLFSQGLGAVGLAGASLAILMMFLVLLFVTLTVFIINILKMFVGVFGYEQKR